MSWITDDWRLKLLAVGLAGLMLGAVAFSQNPPTLRILSVPLHYSLPPNPAIIIIDPPPRIPVTITGLADVIAPVTADNLTAFADATHVGPGPAVKLTVSVNAPSGVTVAPTPPVIVFIDQLKTVEVPVEVLTHPAPGWSVTKVVASCPPNPSPCKVHFSGPASWETGIRAIATYPAPVNFTSADSQNWLIALQNSNGPIDLAHRTNPGLGLDVSTVAIHIEGSPGITSSTVPLVVSAPANPPPPQYEVTGVVVSPVTVVISGDPAVLGKIQRIFLPALDLGGATSSFKVSVTIPYPDNVSGNVVQAQVTYTIQRNPNVSPSP